MENLVHRRPNDNQNCEELPNSEADKKDYGSAAAYAQEVYKWSQSMRSWIAYGQFSNWLQWQQQQNMMMAFQQQQLARQQIFAQQPGGIQPQQEGQRIRLNLTRIFQSIGGPPGIPQTVLVQQHTIPSFFRRIAAESIDAIILFIFKLLLVYALVEFEIIELDQFERILTNEADLQTLIDVTQGLFNIELVCKLLAAIVEALCITFGIMGCPIGCTPGKWIFRLQVISCLDVQPIAGMADRVAITSLPFVNFRSSLLRSVMKNMLTTFLFPLSTAFYMFPYNRAIYDLAAKTIVVCI